MKVEESKTITLQPEEVAQAVANFLSPDHSGVMRDSTEYNFYEDGAAMGSEPIAFGCLEVVIKE